MNILVTGANGQLGTEMRSLASGTADRYLFSDVRALPGVETLPLDITDRQAVVDFCAAQDVDVIVNCAAYTDVERAEDDAAAARLLNAAAPANLAAVAAARGATLIHISTDYVFGGDASVPYREDDPKAPLGVYGQTKYEGELAVEASGCRYLIFRTAWLYSPYGRNFVKTMLRLTAERDSLSVVFDQVGSPTAAADLAALIVQVISDRKLDRTGTYHFTDEGVISWYDFAQEICALSGHSCDIRPVHSDEFPTRAVRPHYSVLDKTLVKETFGIRIPYWKDSLTRCLASL